MNLQPIRRLAVLAAFGLLETPAVSADQYIVRIPAQIQITQPTAPAEPVLVILNPGELDTGRVGQHYEFSLYGFLSITGGSGAYNLEEVTWSLQAGSNLPSGLSLNPAGRIEGVPATSGQGLFAVNAQYQGKSGSQTYRIGIESQQIGIVMQTDGYRSWSDGSFAKSCNEYRTGNGEKTYSGNVGSGVYRIQPSGHAAVDAKCDMDTDGGGWTLVAGVASNNRNHVNTGASTWTTLSDTSPKGKYSDAFINALITRMSGKIGYRMSGNGVSSYFPSTCVFAATTTATGDCATYAKSYAETPVWISGANQSDGCPPPTYYTGLSSMKHGACVTTSPVENGFLVYGRLGNSNTSGMTYQTTGNFMPGISGEVWAR